MQMLEVECAEQLQDFGWRRAAERVEGLVQRLGAGCGVADEIGLAAGAGGMGKAVFVVFAFV